MASTVFVNDFNESAFTLSGSDRDLSIFQPIKRLGGRWEPHIARIIHAIVEPTDICLDIGANIGPFTLLLSDFAHKGHVHSFEPSPSIFSYLSENVTSNNCRNVSTYKLGLGDKPGAQDFHTFPDIPGASFAGVRSASETLAAVRDVFKYDHPFETTSVNFTTLDSWAKQNRIDAIDFIMMDVEGSELAVMNGGLEIFKKRPKLVTEFNTKAMQKYFQINPQEYYDKIRSIYDFIYVINGKELRIVRSLGDIVRNMTDDVFWADLVCLNKEIENFPSAKHLTDIASPGFASSPRLQRFKAAYVTVIPLSWVNNGGSLVCRANARQLAEDPEIDLTIVTIGAEGIGPENSAFADGLGCNFIHIPTQNVKKSLLSLPDALQHPQERAASRDRYSADKLFKSAMKTLNPDVIIVDWMHTAVYIPSLYRMNIPSVMITLNREGEFFGSELGSANNGVMTVAQKIAHKRVVRMERRLYKQSDGLITLSVNDIPKEIYESIPVQATTPLLPNKIQRWNGLKRNDLFFVGNFNHYPNKLAIDWICNKLAPEIFDLNKNFRFKILGASFAEIPESWQRPHIDFLGVGEKNDATQLFVESALLLAPIENNFGSKMKLNECIAHGTPFAATENAISGLPFLDVNPIIDLNDPSGSAIRICDLLNDPTKLEDLSRSIVEQTDRFRQSHLNWWGGFLQKAIDTAKTRRASNN